jgi:hypothetical protein
LQVAALQGLPLALLLRARAGKPRYLSGRLSFQKSVLACS